ncbi:MAG: thioredoxin family protein [Actinomycetota bacterium]
MARPRSQVLYFYGPDCPVCKTMEPFIDEAGEKFGGRVALRKVNVARDQKLAKQYRVMAVPTTVSIANGAEITRIVGAKTPGRLRRVFESAETGEAVEASMSAADRGLRLVAAAGFAGFALWTGAWILWVLVVVALVAASWDMIRR